MLKKHAIFCLEFFSLILLSTASLASYSSYNYSFNKNRTAYLFNKRDNFSQQFMYHDLAIKSMSYGKATEDILSTPASEDKNNEDKTKNWLVSICPVIWGQPFSNRFYGGMWTRHYEQQERHVKNNKLIAFCYKGIYLGTFINSYGDRTYSLGFQRLLYNHKFSKGEIEIGYRFGAVYGYSEYLRLFDTKFFFPSFQVIADISFSKFITQVSWAWIVFNICFGYKF